ncbi:VOC family protein [Sphingobium sp. H33]|uniref:VOC family protein n=2 Tax=Sphingobium nicotianae TaxID=2782607 RepID=A0A9X1D9I1_9SPHN|nr:VOC family protein [Sphingobium nicotianae]
MLIPLSLAFAVAPSAMAAEAPNPLSLAPFMVGLSVADIDKVSAWYVEKLGFKVTLDVPLGTTGGKLRWIEAGSQRIELMSLPDSKPGPERALPPDHAAVRGYTHLTLQVPDLDAAIATLAARGVKPALGPVPVGSLKVKVAFLRDPEGNMVELLQRASNRES